MAAEAPFGEGEGSWPALELGGHAVGGRIDRVDEAVDAGRIDVVINAAAMTDVDGCERDETAAYRNNALAARWLAIAAERHKAFLIHVSTDYVFSGEKGSPYHEWDATGPIQTYGSSKLAGEAEVRVHSSRHLIARTSWLYGGPEKGFVRAILRRAKQGEPLRVVVDQAGSPSFTGDVAVGLIDLMEAGVYGTVHLANAGGASRFDLAREIVRQTGLGVDVLPLDVAPSTPAARPRNTSLASLVLGSVGIRMPTWQEGLHAFMQGEM
jgi:dTDP-4-dehydrorhamnose reductase